MAQWVGQQVSEAVGPGSSLCYVIYFYDSPTFFNFIYTTENPNTFCAWKVSRPELFWNQEGFPYEIFW